MPRVRTILFIAALLLLFSSFAWPAYPGSVGAFLLFDLSFVAMLLLALPRPRSYAYIFFSCMIFLGFWTKLMVHLVTGDNFLEPIGDFSGTSEEWERALVVASIAAIGISIARILHLAVSTNVGSQTEAFSARVPAWYQSWRKGVWSASLVAMLALNLLNFQVAFYQTGVNPTLILPYHLNVPPGWLISVGFALWFAVLIHWEFQASPHSLARTLAIPIVEGLVTSTSALSRSFYFLHTVGYFFSLGSKWAEVRAAVSYRRLTALIALWALGFVISLALVQFLRIHVYFLAYQPAIVSIPAQTEIIATPTLGATSSNQLKPMLREASKLFVDRWVGVEGVLAVSSYPQVGFPLFAEALREDPKKGSASLYQMISKSGAKSSERFTFGTLPGIAGVLFYSGSLAVVLCGMIFMTLLMIGTELACLRFTANPFLTSVMALGLANVVCQINFPYLTAVYVAQLWVAIAFVWLLQSAAMPSPGIQRNA